MAENGPFMVDLPMKTMVIFNGYVELPDMPQLYKVIQGGAP